MLPATGDTPPESRTPVRAACSRCGLDLAAWSVRGDDGADYCTSWCAEQAGALDPHGEELDARPEAST